MTTTTNYDRILATMPPGLEREIFNVLQRGHVGSANRIPFRDLVVRVTGKYTTTTERQVREAIESLRKNHRVAVLSESGKDGRWLAADKQEVEDVLLEWQARRDNLDKVIRALRMAEVPAKMESAKQVGLW